MDYCVKLHQYRFIRVGGVALLRNMERQTEEPTGLFVYTLCLREVKLQKKTIKFLDAIWYNYSDTQ